MKGRVFRSLAKWVGILFLLLSMVGGQTLALTEQLPLDRSALAADPVSIGQAVSGGQALAVEEPLNLDGLTANADTILVGQVKDITCYQEGKGNIFTSVTLTVQLMLKGQTEREVVVEVPGGEVDGLRLWVSDSPSFSLGEDTVVFLKKADKAFKVCSCRQGKFTIKNNRVVEKNQSLTDFIADISRSIKTQGIVPNISSKQMREVFKGIVNTQAQVLKTEAFAAGWQNIMTDGFEGSFPGTKWSLYGTPTWAQESYRRYTGTYSVWCAGSSYNPPSNYPSNMSAWTVYGPFSLVGTSDAELNYYLWLEAQSPDSIMIMASTDGSNFYGEDWTGSSSGNWLAMSFDLTNVYTLGNLCGQSQVWIAFLFESDGATTAQGAFIDDVVLRSYISGGTPPQITSISPTSDSAGTDSQVTITGSNFGATQGTSAVEFWRIDSTYITAPVVSWSDTQIVCRVPSGASSGDASHGVRVTTSAGTSNNYAFTVTFSYGEIKWPATSPMGEKVWINPNTSDCDGELRAVIDAMQAWNNVSNANFYFEYAGITNAINYSYNGYNEIMWVNYDTGSIATTSIWSISGEIVECDIRFNDLSYTWDTSGSPSKMDVQNIATHELGHYLLLLDLYGTVDSEKTMYGYGTTGETKKRTLEAQDTAGIQWIYPGAGTRGQYHIKVTNNDDDSLTVYFKSDIDADYTKSFDITSGQTSTSWWEVVPNGNHQISIRWTDPDKGTADFLNSSANVTIKGDTEFSFTIPRYPTTPPVVTTDNATNISYFSARLYGTLNSLGTASSANVSFQWGFSSGNYTGETTVQSVNATGSYYSDFTGLSANTTYYFRAKAVAHGIGYGDEQSFTTLPTTPPSVITDNATSITFQSARLNGNLTDLGTASSANVSFEWGFSSGNYTGETPGTANFTGGSFSANLTGISANTTYYFRAKAIGHGISYGSEESFTTLPMVAPTVVTSNATTVYATSASLSGNLTSMGTASSVIVFFEYGLTTSYGSNSTAGTLTDINTFNTIINGLAPNTTYHFRAIANGGIHGTGTGGDMTFTTLPPTSPTVTTDDASNLTTTTARLNGTVSSLGSASSANVSFQWGVSTGNYTAETPIQTTNVTGSFSANLTGLTDNTTYYFRIKATGFSNVSATGENVSHGTSYGAEGSFFTVTETIPPAAITNLTVTADTASSVNLTWTAVGDDNMTGTATYYDIRFLEGTTPITDSNWASANQTTGEPTPKVAGSSENFTVTGLLTGKTYYFAIKAIDKRGNVSPISNSPSAALVTPQAPYSLNGATANATRIDLTWTDNSTNELGFRLERSDSADFSSLTSFTVSVNVTAYSDNSVSGGNTYYYRVFAYNGVGDSTASNTANVSTTVPAAPSGITATATAYNRVNLSWTDNSTNETGFRIERNSSANFTGTSTNFTAGINATTYSDTSVAASTTYWYRIFAYNGIGDSPASNNISVSTPAAPGGGGGGGGGGGPTGNTVTIMGFTPLTPLKLDSNGILQETAQLKSDNGRLILDIAKGTRLLDEAGSVLKTLSCVEVQSPSPAQSRKVIILAYELGTNGAKFDPAITLTIQFDPKSLPDGINISDLYIAFWDGNEWKSLTSEVNTQASIVTAPVDHFSQFAVIGELPPPQLPPAPARFTVSDLIVTPITCKPGEEVTISARVRNIGGTAGQYEVVLNVNGVKEDTKSVTLSPGTSQTVQFTVSKSTPDTYEIEVGGVIASFVVEQPAPLQESVSTPTPSVTSAPAMSSATKVRWWIIGAVVGAAVIGGVIYGALRRKRRA